MDSLPNYRILDVDQETTIYLLDPPDELDLPSASRQRPWLGLSANAKAQLPQLLEP